MAKTIKYLLILVLIPFFGNAQDTLEAAFTFEIARVEGDLNNDGNRDVAIVTQDTLQDDSPYRLEIYFSDENGKMELIVRTDKAIIPQFPNGKDGYLDGHGFDSLGIVKGELLIENQLIRGRYVHVFRFQNNQFELIRHSYLSASLGKIYTTDYDLITGRLIQSIESYENDEVFKDSKSIVKLDSLPSLSEFLPLEGDNY